MLREFTATVICELCHLKPLVSTEGLLMGMRVPSSFHEHFAALTDPRCPLAPNSRHLLMDILVIAVCAVISGAEGWEDIEEYGTAHAEWLGDLLDLPHGIPGHDTFRGGFFRVGPGGTDQRVLAGGQGPQGDSRGAVFFSLC